MHRIPHSRISHLTIDGDVMVSLINFESGMPKITESSPQMSQPQYGPPQQPMGMFQPGAPQYDPIYNPAMGQGGGLPPPPGYNEVFKKIKFYITPLSLKMGYVLSLGNF